MTRGRPRIYATDEERRAAHAAVQKAARARAKELAAPLLTPGDLADLRELAGVALDAVKAQKTSRRKKALFEHFLRANGLL